MSNGVITLELPVVPSVGIDLGIFESAADDNYGGFKACHVGLETAGPNTKGIIRFDGLSAIPTDAIIVSAILDLMVTWTQETPERNLYIHRGLVEWFPGTVIGVPPGANDGSTWNHRNANTGGQIVWTGGPGGAAGVEYTSVASASWFATYQAGEPYVYSNLDVLSDVKGFIDGAYPNWGWWIIGEEENNGERKGVSTSEEPEADWLPKLTVVYYEYDGSISGVGARSLGGSNVFQNLYDSGAGVKGVYPIVNYVPTWNYDPSLASGIPMIQKRVSPLFDAAPIIQGKWDGSGIGDVIKFSRGDLVSGNAYDNLDPTQGSIVLWITPEWAGDGGVQHYIYDTGSNDCIKFFVDSSGIMTCWIGGEEIALLDISGWSVGQRYCVILRWDTNDPIDATHYTCLSVDNTPNFVHTVKPTAGAPVQDIHIGSQAGAYSANAIIEGFTVYTRVLYDGTYGEDDGNGDELTAIYNAGTGAKPESITGDTDICFQLPTDGVANRLETGTGEAWSYRSTARVDVSLTVIPTSQANSIENGGIRVDGYDRSVTDVTGVLGATSGKVRFRWIPRHGYGDFRKFGTANQPMLVNAYKDADNDFGLGLFDDDQIILQMNIGGVHTYILEEVSSIVADNNYLVEVEYTPDQIEFRLDGVIITGYHPVGGIDYGANVSDIIYIGSNYAPNGQADAVFSAP